jgi:hypothetical protein
MLLDSTATLEFSVDSGTAVRFVAWAVNDNGSSLTPVFNAGASNGATPVNIIAAPAASNTRRVKWVGITNGDSVGRTVTVRIDVSGTDYNQASLLLPPGESIEFTGELWVRRDAVGRIYTNGLRVGASAVLIGPGFATASLSSTRTITSTNTMAVYMGKCPRRVTESDSVDMRYRVTTAAATITWAEIAVATGAINVGSNPTLTVRGFTDVSAVVTSTGQKTTAVSPSAGQVIEEGDDLWALIGGVYSTALVVRAQSMADDLQVGIQASRVTRPSLNVGSGEAYTLDDATTLAPWVALVL